MGFPFDLGRDQARELERLMRLLSGTDVEECEIEQGETHILLRRQVGSPASEQEALPTETAGEPSESPIVRAPAVGFFRRAENRSSLPSVEVGAPVKVGDVLGFIQVMNLPQSVLSTHEGTIEAFLAEDGLPVEYGQPLVSISPRQREGG